MSNTQIVASILLALDLGVITYALCFWKESTP